MKRKLLMSLVAAILMVFSISNVNAATTYKTGDLITVEINGTETRDFYVIEDKGDYVVAISKNNLGSAETYFQTDVSGCYTPGLPGSLGTVNWDNSNIKTELESRTSTWTNVNKVRLLNKADLEGLLKKDLTSNTTSAVNESISAYSWLTSTTSYWTMEIAIYQPSSSTLCDVWLISGSTLTQSSGCYERDIKPVVEVEKDHIVEDNTVVTPDNEPPINENNPNTGVTSLYVVGGIAVLGLIGATIILKKKNYFVKI